MLNSISANIYSSSINLASSQSNGHTVSTEVGRAESASAPGTGIIDLDVQLSDHIQRLTENQAMATAELDDALTRLTPGSRRQVSATDIGASDREYSTARELNGFDIGSDVDTAGGPFELLDRVLSALHELGDNPLLAQTKLLPTDSAFWVSAQPSLLG